MAMRLSSIIIVVIFVAFVIASSIAVSALFGSVAQIAWIIPCILLGSALGKWLAYRDFYR